MSNILKNINAYILIGGHSRRFKKDKCLDIINDKTLTDYVYETLKPIFKNVFTVGKINKFKKYNFIEDKSDVQCPLNGIITGMEHSENKWIFVIACDMPLIRSNLIYYLFDQFQFEEQIIIPKINDRLQPLCAFYNKSVLNHFNKAISSGKFSLITSFENLSVNEVNVDRKYENQFMNINYPDDLEKASKLFSK